MIDPERGCTRKHRRQGVLSVRGLTIAALMQGALHRVRRDGPGSRAAANSGSRRRSPCTQDRYRGLRMGPYLHRAGPGYDEVGVAPAYGGLVRSKLSWARSGRASSCSAWSA